MKTFFSIITLLSAIAISIMLILYPPFQVTAWYQELGWIFFSIAIATAYIAIAQLIINELKR